MIIEDNRSQEVYFFAKVTWATNLTNTVTVRYDGFYFKSSELLYVRTYVYCTDIVSDDTQCLQLSLPIFCVIKLNLLH